MHLDCNKDQSNLKTLIICMPLFKKRAWDSFL